MAEKIRLGLIGASVRGTWSARSHLPALRASDDIELTAVCTTRADSAEAARQAYGARLAFDDWREDGCLARDRRGRGRRARAVALRADQGGARSRQARLLRMAAGPHHRGGRRTGGTGPVARAENGGRVAGARRSGADAYEGAGRPGLCRRDHGGQSRPVARRRPDPPVAPHLAARRLARRQHADHRQRPHDRCDALRDRRFPLAVGGRRVHRRSNGSIPARIPGST